MNAPLRTWIAYERAETAAELRRIAQGMGLSIEREISLDSPNALDDLGGCALFILEQHDPITAVEARVYSLARANPDVMVVVAVDPPRTDWDARLLRARAFDVLALGPGLAADLEHTVATARRVAELQGERAQLTNDLAHQEKLSALGVLAAGVSHEINNPCAAILSNMIVMREQLESLIGRPPSNRVEALESSMTDWIESIGDCIHAANRIHSIVKTLGMFSRKNDSAPMAIDVNEEIATVLRLIGKEVHFQASIELSLAPDMPRIMAPPNSITQVVTNLVVNALQALQEAASPEPKLSITTSFDDSAVMMVIRDNGPGMTAEVSAHIFDPFYTTKPVGKGTGLGLSITRQLVQRMRGEIFVESEPSKGASFSVMLERSAKLDAAPITQRRVPPNSDRLRVLLLDDDELILRSMHRSLSDHFECLPIAHGQLALDALRSDEDFDVVVSDVVMPEMNGIEFYSALKLAHPQLAQRTLFLSGGIVSESLYASVAGTGRPCLAKPVDLAELVRSIRRVGRPFEELGR